MSKIVTGRKNVTLDPDNWDETRALGHQMVNDMMTYLQTIETKPTMFPTKEAIKNICSPLSEEGEGEKKVYEVFKNDILPYTVPITRPRMWAMVAGTGSPFGMLAEMLRAGTNSGVEMLFAEGYVHQQVIDWIKNLLDFPIEAGGVLVSGGTEANFTALAVARNSKAEVDVKSRGVQALKKRMTLYCSDEAHHCMERSVELLGLGNEALKWVPTDDHCRIKLDALKEMIEDDRKAGFHPFCIVGCAGTVNSGAFDDLNALRDLANQEKMWFHVDGAFGAWVKLSKTHRHLADGMESADSLAVDLHKWMDMPYGIGCTLVKDRAAHFKTFVFGHEAEYAKSGLELSEDQLSNPSNLSLQWSRNFTSLKAYMLLRANGSRKYRDLIQQNLDQINYLAGLIKNDPDFELTTPLASNAVCFRYRPKGLGEAEVEKLNKLIYSSICDKSFWIISDTTMKGKYSLRACNVNHRSRLEDFDYLISLVKELGAKHRSDV